MRLAVSFCVLLLVACGEKPTNIEQMSEAMSTTLNESSISEAPNGRKAIDLSIGFGPAISAAVIKNEGYQAAAALESEAMGRIGVAESVRRLQVRGNANLGGIREKGGVRDQTTIGAAGGITLSQLVYDGGESVAAVNRATAEALSARAERELRGNDTALQAARAWIDVWQFGERLRLLRVRTAQMDTLITQMERMASNGYVDRAALDSARRQVVDIALEDTRLEADLREARGRFSHYYNQSPTAVSAPVEIFTLAEARAAAGTWRTAPGLERSAAALLVAQSAVVSAEAAFRPRARLQAGVTTPMQEGESTDTTVGLMFEYTFGDGGRRKSQLKAALARAEAVEAQLSDTKRTMEVELEAALTRLAAIERSMPLVAEKLRISETEAQTARSQIATGQSNLVQLIEAEIENYRAQDRKLALRAERHVLLLIIASQTGALGRRLGLVS